MFYRQDAENTPRTQREVNHGGIGVCTERGRKKEADGSRQKAEVLLTPIVVENPGGGALIMFYTRSVGSTGILAVGFNPRSIGIVTRVSTHGLIINMYNPRSIGSTIHNRG